MLLLSQTLTTAQKGMYPSCVRKGIQKKSERSPVFSLEREGCDCKDVETVDPGDPRRPRIAKGMRKEEATFADVVFSIQNRIGMTKESSRRETGFTRYNRSG